MTVWIPALALGALAVAVAVELACRWWIRRRTGYHVWLPGMRLELRQNADAFTQVEPRVRFEVNADGERGSDVRADQDGLFRVLVVGGSSAECLALDQPTSWPGVLERRLASDAARRTLGARVVHVGNIARSGIGSRQLDLILEHVLPRYGQLDALLIMVGASDLLRWLEEGAPPSLGPEPEVEDVFSSHPRLVFGWTPRRSAVLALAGRLRRRWLRPIEVREHAGSWLTAARKMRAEAREIRHTTPDPCVMLRAFDEHFRRLLRRAQAHADRVLVVRQPWFDRVPTADEAAHFWHGGVGKAWKQTIDIFYGLDVLSDLMGRIDSLAAAIAGDLGVPQVDLRPILTPNLDHYFDMFHYTPRGAAVVGWTVAEALLGVRPLQRESPPWGLRAASAVPAATEELP
jgi:lysophospholipase L1-like esterase